MGLGGYFAAPGTIIGWQEGEELQANLLQASQRIPANSSVPDEVFGIHSPFEPPKAHCGHATKNADRDEELGGKSSGRRRQRPPFHLPLRVRWVGWR